MIDPFGLNLAGGLLVAALAAGLAVVLALVWSGNRRWDGLTRTLTARLGCTRLPMTTLRYEPGELEGLPSPVQRYFRAVLKPGQAIITAVTMAHRGTFNISAGGERWLAFSSTQVVLTRPPGFVWNARISIIPGIAVLVHDAYVGGSGILHPALLGWFSLPQQSGSGEIARGELMRYLAESVWYPTALLPSQGVRWSAVDDRSARATLRDGELSVTLLFSFDAAGLVEATHADARGALVDGAIVMLPWECRVSNYQLREGIRIPLAGEVAWLPPGGRQPYYRGVVASIRYDDAG